MSLSLEQGCPNFFQTLFNFEILFTNDSKHLGYQRIELQLYVSSLCLQTGAVRLEQLQLL